MARIFLSHSSADNFEAKAIYDWLIEEGWDDVFFDISTRSGIAAAELWERRLHEAANRCEAVVFLVSRGWLASEWCVREFNLAMRLNKRLFGVLIEDVPTAELRAEMGAWQVVNLARGQDGVIRRVVMDTGEEKHVTYSRAGLAKLRFGLQRAGLDPRFFEWPPEDDPERPPYRGMKPLEADDAGIFFGREAHVIEALDRLRGLADAAAPRFLAILGASGAGKSSFMRAGLLPRLDRDDRHFITLPVIRPERAAISGDAGLITSLEEALQRAGRPKSRAEIKAALASGAEATTHILAELAEAARAPQLEAPERPAPPAIVIPVDQGEELFSAEGQVEAEALLQLVASLLLADAPRIILLVTIRSDSYETLQTAKQLASIRQATFSLPPLAKGAFLHVIEGPSIRLRNTNRPLRIEPALIAALLADVEVGNSKDALPLLAFTLERLWREHGTTGDLKLAHYEDMGGVKGSIEAAVERAMKAAETDPDLCNVTARQAILRRSIIPWLATIDQETKTPRRRVARLSEIPIEAHPFIRLLVAERLLSTEQAYDATGRKDGSSTVEPAHEALLRQWPQLQQWLQEESAAYAAIDGIKLASMDWQSNSRDAAWLMHRAGRLEDAERVAERDDFGRLLSKNERSYLAAARKADNNRRDQELARQRQLARRTRIAGAVLACLAIVALGFAYYGLMKASEADQQREIAEAQASEALISRSDAFAALAENAIQWGSAGEGVKLALDAMPETVDGVQRLRFRAAEAAAHHALQEFQGPFSKPFLPELERLSTSRLNVWGGIDLSRDLMEGHAARLLSRPSPGGSFAVAEVISAERSTLQVLALPSLGSIYETEMIEGVEDASVSADGKTVAVQMSDKSLMTISIDSNARKNHRDVISGDLSFINDQYLLVSSEATVQLVAFGEAVEPGSKKVEGCSAFVGMNGAIYTIDAQFGDGSDGEETSLVLVQRSVRTIGSGLEMSEERRWPLPHNVAGTSPGCSGSPRLLGVSQVGLPGVLIRSPDSKLHVIATDHSDLVVKSLDLQRDGAVHASDDLSSIVACSAFETCTFAYLPLNYVKELPEPVLEEADYGLTGEPSPQRVVVDPVGRYAVVTTSSTAVLYDLVNLHQKILHRPVVVTGQRDSFSTSLVLDHGASDAFFVQSGNWIVTTNDKWIRSWRSLPASIEASVYLPDVLETRNFVDVGVKYSGFVVVSPNGALIAATNFSDYCYLISAENWTVTHRLDMARDLIRKTPSHQYEVAARPEGFGDRLAFSPSGEMLVTASILSTAALWTVAEGKHVADLVGHKATVRHVAFSAAGDFIITSSDDGTVILWSSSDGKQREVLDGFGSPVFDARTDNKDEVLIVSTADGNVTIVDLRTRARTVTKAHEGFAYRTVVSPDNTSFISMASDGSVALWDMPSRSIRKQISAHESYAWRGAFSGNSELFVTGSNDGWARVFSSMTGDEVQSLEIGTGIGAVHLNGAGDRLNIIGYDGHLYRRDVKTGLPLADFRYPMQDGDILVHGAALTERNLFAVIGPAYRLTVFRLGDSWQRLRGGLAELASDL